jgi:hypothetical protein
LEKISHWRSRLAILAMAFAGLSVPLSAGTITYQLTDVHTVEFPSAITGFFTLDPVTTSLVSFDIKSGGIEWTPANTRQSQIGPQSLSILLCVPYTRADCPDATTYTLFFSVPIPFADAPASEPITHGILDIVFPNDSAEFQYGVAGAITLAPEPSTIALSLAGLLFAMWSRRTLHSERARVREV